MSVQSDSATGSWLAASSSFTSLTPYRQEFIVALLLVLPCPIRASTMNWLLTIFIVAGSFLVQGEAKSCGTNPSVVHLQRGQRQRVQFWTNQIVADSSAFNQDLAIESRNAALRSEEDQDQDVLPKITIPLSIESGTDVTQKAESRSDDSEESDVDRLSNINVAESASFEPEGSGADLLDVTLAPATDSPVTGPARPVGDDQVGAIAMDDQQDNIEDTTEIPLSHPIELEISPIPAPMAADQVNSEHSVKEAVVNQEFPEESTVTDSSDINSLLKAEHIAEVTQTTDMPETGTEMNEAVADEVTEPCVTIVRYYVNAAGEKVFLTQSVDQPHHEASKSSHTDSTNEISSETLDENQPDETTSQSSLDVETATDASSVPIEMDASVTEIPVTDASVSEPMLKTESKSSESVKSVQEDAETATVVSDVSEEPPADTPIDLVELDVPQVSVEPGPSPVPEMDASHSDDGKEVTTTLPLSTESATEYLKLSAPSSIFKKAVAIHEPLVDDQPPEVETAISVNTNPFPVDDTKTQKMQVPTGASSASGDRQEDNSDALDSFVLGTSQLADDDKFHNDNPQVDSTEAPLQFDDEHQTQDVDPAEPEGPTEIPLSDFIPDPIPETSVAEMDSTELPPDVTESFPVTEPQTTEVPTEDENDFFAREDLLISRIRNIVDSLSKPRDSLFFKRTSGFLQTVGSVFRRPRRQSRLDPFFVIQAPDLSKSAKESTAEQEDVYRSFLQNVGGQGSTSDSIITGKPASAVSPTKDSARDSSIVDVKVSGYLPFQRAAYRPGSAVDDTAAIRAHLITKSRHLATDAIQRIRRSDPSLLQFIYSRPLPLRRALSMDPRAAKKILSPQSTQCDLHIKTEPGLYLLITFHNLSAPHTVDCTGAFIEIERENNGFEARWCGNKIGQERGTRSHVIFARTEVRISVFDSGVENEDRQYPTGFTADVEVVDLHDAGKYASFQRSEAYSSVHRRMG